MKLHIAFFVLLLGSSIVLFSQDMDLRNMPDGVSVQVAEDGSYQILSVGTGTYDFNDPDDINDARNEAVLNAKAGIAKFFKEDIVTEGVLAKISKKAKFLSKDGENQNNAVAMTTMKKAVESIRQSSNALLRGVITLQDAKIPHPNGGGSMKVLVGVSSLTVGVANVADKEVTGAANAPQPMQQVVPIQQPVESTQVAPVENVDDNQANSGLQGATQPNLPEGWIVCVGRGKDRGQAVNQALIEGISQVYGVQLQNDSRFSERMTKVKKLKSIDGKEVTEIGKKSKKYSESNTLTQTAGFVKEYRIAQVVPKEDMQEATVYAYIVNPRAGGTIALRVYSPAMAISMRTKMYKLGDNKQLSGEEVGKEINTALPTGLMNANKFLIITDYSEAQKQDNVAITQFMVANGQANVSELMQLGQGLTPDYSLKTEVLDIQYNKKIGMNKKTKKLEPQYRMSIKLRLTLTNERTSEQPKSSILELRLDSQEISAILEQDENADLLQALLEKLAEPLEQWFNQ